MNYATIKNQAVQQLRQYQYDTAQLLYRQCLEIETIERCNYWYLGLTYLLQGKRETAEEIWLLLLLESSLEDYELWLGELTGILHDVAIHYRQSGYLSGSRLIYEYLVDQFSDQADSYYDLGNILADQGFFSQAIEQYQQALNLDSTQAKYYAKLGYILSEQGDSMSGYTYLLHAINLEPHHSLYKKWWAISLRTIVFRERQPTIVTLIIDCFQQPDIRKDNLVNAGLSLLKLTPEFQEINQYCQLDFQDFNDEYCRGNFADFLEDKLTECLLSYALIASLEIEHLLTTIRKAILLNFDLEKLSENENLNLSFVCALAHQCYHNEYIFQVGEEEKIKIGNIEVVLNKMISELYQPNLDNLSWHQLEIILSIFALYSPLYILQNSCKLLTIDSKKISSSFYALLEQTLINYYQEREIIKNIECLTKIEDQVSLLVQSQYEENPYPRWLGFTILPSQPITTVFGNSFPYFEVPSQLINRKLEVLIAGCGTGREAVYTAMKHGDTNVLAVDISSSSLAYAIRMAQKYQLNNITFKQADILSLSSLKRKFDLISSTGVIHHLDQPLVGWEILNELLVPSGLIRLGLYSKTARHFIKLARNFIANHQYQPTPEDIKKCRQAIIKLASTENIQWVKEIVNLYDFYNLSHCRDLIFHVCEHCFMLPQLKQMIEQFNLDFIGLEVSPSTRKLYQEMFPYDHRMNQLEQWHQLEEAHPLTFISMYNFWCQKR